MKCSIQFLGAAGEVTGSCHLVTVDNYKILLDCGMIQGGSEEEKRNFNDFPFDPASIDAVILSHAHIDHSGRIPLLIKAGYQGYVFTHPACRDLCRIMLKDAGFLNEKDAEWDNRKLERKGLPLVEPMFTVDDAIAALRRFKGLVYDRMLTILPGVSVRLLDAGHILGSSIIELYIGEGDERRKIVYSGDLGRTGMPVLKDPAVVGQADLVIMESTYGDRLHRTWEASKQEFEEVITRASNGRGNILMPAFAVGRTQEILYLFAKHYKDWRLDRWHIFLDSPMAIEATQVFLKHNELFDEEAVELWRQQLKKPLLPNLHLSHTANQSMAINRIRSGAIIIAGSGMCTGGRIRHHLKHNIWRKECQVVITGFQARGTTGRAILDGASHITLWGESIRVAATIHTIGGLSAHADQAELTRWYSNFEGNAPVVLVHGEQDALTGLSTHLRKTMRARVLVARNSDVVELKANRKATVNGKEIT